MKSTKNSFAKKLGQAIILRRKSLGLTQKEVSELAGCGVAFLYLVETGKPSLRLDKLVDVLKVLGLELKLVSGKMGLSVSEDLA